MRIGRFGLLLLVELVSLVAPAHAGTADYDVEFMTLNTSLRTIETQLDTMSAQMEEMARDIKELKECNALARQSPMSLADFRMMFKPVSKEDDRQVVELFRKDVLTRAKCGLSQK